MTPQVPPATAAADESEIMELWQIPWQLLRRSHQEESHQVGADRKPPAQICATKRCLTYFSQAGQKKEPADKPGSVVGDHPSGTAVTSGLERPTRKPAGRRCGTVAGAAASLFGLAPGGVFPAAACYHPRGALLPHLFTRTAGGEARGGIFSVALSVGSRPPGVTWHPARRSPDFPPLARLGERAATVRPTP